MTDAEQVAMNCKLYNGPDHPLTRLAESLVDEITIFLEQHKEEMDRLELEITEEANALTQSLVNTSKPPITLKISSSDIKVEEPVVQAAPANQEATPATGNEGIPKIQ